MLNLHETASPAARDLKRRLIEAEERERNRVARELHDDIGQQLVTLSMDIARLREMLPAQSDARALTTTLRDQVLSMARGIQGISRRLHSPKIDVMGLAGAAGSLCQELAAQHRVEISFSHEGVPSDLPCDVALHLYRVLQEALANAIKHSGARHHIVTLRGTAEGLQLDIDDDGCGFDVAAALERPGLGLVSMRDRLNLVNGAVVIESSAGRGTRIRALVNVPARKSGPTS